MAVDLVTIFTDWNRYFSVWLETIPCGPYECSDPIPTPLAGARAGPGV
jgi:hypothetical protein